jgi:hypothetical protein
MCMLACLQHERGKDPGAIGLEGRLAVVRAEAEELDALQIELRRAVSSIQSERSRLISEEHDVGQASIPDLIA